MNDQTVPAIDEQAFDLSRARVRAIVNMGSGRGAGGDIADRLDRALRARVAALDIRSTEKGADLTGMAEEAVADGIDLIIAAGGDGTQAAIASAIAGTDTAMAVIPGGTFNYFARDLGSGETLDEALRIFDAPRLRHVHVGDVNGMLFLNNISFGAYPEILRRRESIYRRWGRSRVAAYWSAVVALWSLRENISEAQKREGISIKHDISVPVSAIPGFLDAAGAALAAAYPGLRIVCFGHLGDGNLHYNLSRPVRGENDEFIARTPEVNRIVYDITENWDIGVLGSTFRGQYGANQYAYGAEVGRLLRQNLWLSVGYNATGFRGDDDLTGYEYTQQGAFIRLRFKFDEDLFRREDARYRDPVR